MAPKFLDFVTPHCHSSASLDTASRPETFAAWEAEHETGAMTVTDHATLGGVRRVYDLCAKKYKGKLHCIPGLEAYVRDDDCPILLGAGITKNEQGKLIDYQKYFHLTLHFLDQEAYETAVRVLSRADARAERHGKERKPLFGWSDLEELGAKNVTFGSSCLVGVVQRHLAFAGRPDLAEAYYRRIRSIAKPGNWYVEVFPHVCAKNWESAIFLDFADGTSERFPVWKKLRTSKNDKNGTKAEWLARTWRAGERADLVAVMDNRRWTERPSKTIVAVRYVEDFLQNECTAFAPDGDLQAPCNRWVLEMAAKCGDTVLVSDDSHFVNPDEKIVQDIKLQQSGSWRFATSYHRLSSAEAWEYFDRVLKTPQADFERWIDNSRAWAARFKGLKFVPRRSLPTSFYPAETLDHTLDLIEFQGRMDWNDAGLTARLKREIDLLHNNGTIDLLPYFFIDEEVCRLYENAGWITGPGRGSAAGLALTNLLGITHVDPRKYGLSVERFITPDRIQSGKMPDIDQDLPHRDLLVAGDKDFDDEDEEERKTEREKREAEAAEAHLGDPEYKGEDDPDVPPPSNKGWLAERFGPCCVRVSTDISMKLRASVLDVMRYLSPDHVIPKEVVKLTGKFAKAPQGVSDRDFVFGYADGDNWVDGSILSDEALITFTKMYPKEWEIVQKCLGIPKTRGQHACAFAISDEPISDFIPTTSVSGVTVTQPTAEQVEAWGALKMDFLVIKNLLFIQDAIRLIQRRHGGDTHDWAAPGRFAARFLADPEFRRRAMDRKERAPSIQIDGKRVPLIRVVPHRGGVHDIWNLPEDQAVFRMICEGETESVFQFRTPGARDWLHHFDHARRVEADGTVHKALDSIEGLAAFTALDRPGPLKYFVEGPDGKSHNMLVEYARRARGESPIGSFPILDQLFPETFGVIVYQEQVQKAFHEIGGTTALQANDFRIHVAKKQPMEIINDRNIFMPGAIQRVGKDAAEQLFKSMQTFGEYGFNKSHAVCYVTVSYACAYLKHHYPLEWWCAVLCNAKKKDIEEKYWKHCGRLVDMPDIRLSGENYEIVDERIRAPLSLIRGVGDAAHEELCSYRPIESMHDLIAKIEARKTEEAKVVQVQKEGAPATTKTVRGRSALTSGTFEAMIVAGAMDGFFPSRADVLEKLQEYIRVEAGVTGNVYKKTGAPKRKVPEKFLSLGPLERFQLRKRLLPQTRDDLFELALPMLWSDPSKQAGVLAAFGGYMVGSDVRLADGSTFQQWSWNSRNGNSYGMVKAAGIHHFGAMPVMRGAGSLRVAAIAYVTEFERKVSYNTDPPRERGVVTLDVDGETFNFVMWPPRGSNNLPESVPKELDGAVAIALLSRWTTERPFAIDDLVILRGPFAEKESKHV
jgi:DNA polymerase III alpha subunit